MSQFLYIVIHTYQSCISTYHKQHALTYPLLYNIYHISTIIRTFIFIYINNTISIYSSHKYANHLYTCALHFHYLCMHTYFHALPYSFSYFHEIIYTCIHAITCKFLLSYNNALHMSFNVLQHACMYVYSFKYIFSCHNYSFLSRYVYLDIV